MKGSVIFSQYSFSILTTGDPAPLVSAHPSSSFPCIFFVFLVLYSVSRLLLHRFLFVTHHLSHNFVTHAPSFNTIFHTQLVTLHLLHASFVNHHLSHTTVSHTIYKSFTHNFCHTPSLTHTLSTTTFSHTIFFTWQAWHICGDMTKQIWFLPLVLRLTA